MPMSSCIMLLCANIFLFVLMFGWIPLGFCRIILSVVVGSIVGGFRELRFSVLEVFVHCWWC